MHSEQTTTTYSSPVSAAQGGGPKKEVMLWQTPKCCTRSLTLTEQPTLVGGGPSLQLVLTAPDAQDFSPCLCETLGCVHKTTTFAVPGNAAPVHAQPAGGLLIHAAGSNSLGYCSGNSQSSGQDHTFQGREERWLTCDALHLPRHQ